MYVAFPKQVCTLLNTNLHFLRYFTTYVLVHHNFLHSNTHFISMY